MYDKKRFLSKLACGLCSKARKGRELPTIYMAAGLRKAAEPEREPVAYLYNGVRLPKLPEWDTETYPYACIAIWNNNLDGGIGYMFRAWNTTDVYFDETEQKIKIKGPHGWAAVQRLATAGSSALALEPNVWTKWIDEEECTVDHKQYTYCNISVNYGFLWTNFDLFEEDGTTLRLAASEPIPVYK